MKGRADLENRNTPKRPGRSLSERSGVLYHPLTGRPVGSIEFKGRSYDYVDQTKKWAAEFLSKVTTQENKNMATAKVDTNEKTNMVFLAGIVQMFQAETERLFFTLDVGMKQYVPCSVYKNPEIQKQLNGLYKGDFVQVKALLRPWSRKNDAQEWQRGLNVEITEVKNVVRGTREPERMVSDDLPF